jgi:NTP pyrophosphatase (non-canonical NTP hydrolase)
MDLGHNEKGPIDLIIDALMAAEKKHPGWVDDPIHAAAILAEESGELVRAANDYYYGHCPDKARMIEEAAQTGAMAIRFLLNIKNYNTRCEVSAHQNQNIGDAS